MIAPKEMSVEDFFHMVDVKKDPKDCLEMALTWIKSLLFHTRDMVHIRPLFSMN